MQNESSLKKKNKTTPLGTAIDSELLEQVHFELSKREFKMKALIERGFRQFLQEVKEGKEFK